MISDDIIWYQMVLYDIIWYVYTGSTFLRDISAWTWWLLNQVSLSFQAAVEQQKHQNATPNVNKMKYRYFDPRLLPGGSGTPKK